MRSVALPKLTCLVSAISVIIAIDVIWLIWYEAPLLNRTIRIPAATVRTAFGNKGNDIYGATAAPLQYAQDVEDQVSLTPWEIRRLDDITPELATAVRAYAEAIFTERPLYRLTHEANPHGFCSNVLAVARAYAVSVHTGRSLVRSRTSWRSYNCPSRDGYQCFFDTSGVLSTDAQGLQRACERDWRRNETIRDGMGFPVYYSNHSSLCANVPFMPGRQYSGPTIAFPPMPSSDVPGVTGPLPAMTQLALCVLWRLTDETARAVTKAKARLALNRPYVGLHVRRGDKKEGARKPPVIEYLKRVTQSSSERFRTVFLASDDEATIEEARFAVKMLNLTAEIQVLPSFFGRNVTIEASKHLKEKSAAEQFAETADLIAEMEILAGADVFVGTGTSNVGCVVVALRACRGYKEETAFTVDKPWERQISRF